MTTSCGDHKSVVLNGFTTLQFHKELATSVQFIPYSEQNLRRLKCLKAKIQRSIRKPGAVTTRNLHNLTSLWLRLPSWTHRRRDWPCRRSVTTWFKNTNSFVVLIKVGRTRSDTTSPSTSALWKSCVTLLGRGARTITGQWRGICWTTTSEMTANFGEGGGGDHKLKEICPAKKFPGWKSNEKYQGAPICYTDSSLRL